MTRRSNKPFVEALRDLMAERDLSFRKLAYQTAGHRPNGESYSIAYISALLQNRSAPTVENMEVLAKAAGAHPTYFAEVRDAYAARRATELVREVGLEEVLRALDDLREG